MSAGDLERLFDRALQAIPASSERNTRTSSVRAAKPAAKALSPALSPHGRRFSSTSGAPASSPELLRFKRLLLETTNCNAALIARVKKIEEENAALRASVSVIQAENELLSETLRETEKASSHCLAPSQSSFHVVPSFSGFVC